MEKEIESFVFYKNDYENLKELQEESQQEILCCLLREIFNDEKPKLKPQNKAIYKMFRDKIMRSVKNYQSKKYGGGNYER